MREQHKLSLPFFTGFYHSTHNDRIEWAIESMKENMKEDMRESPEDSVDIFDKIDRQKMHKEYSEEYAKGYIGILKRDFQEYRNTVGIKLISFDKLLSPKYYNYETDEIIVNVEFNVDIIVKYLTENKEEFSKYIAEKNGSYDGFISAMETEFNDYIEEVKEGVHHYQLSQILEFYILDGEEKCDIDWELAEENQELVYELIQDSMS